MTQYKKDSQQYWEERLKKEGLVLKEPSTRNKRFGSQEQTREFFLTLDAFLTHYPELDLFERKVLQMYSNGNSIVEINKKLKHTSKIYIERTIKRYSQIIVVIQRLINR